MAYRLRIAQPIQKEVRRVLIAQIDKARTELARDTLEPANIHETRKALKRLRSLFQLIRPGLTQKEFHRENKRYRTIARSLSALRDRQILRETIDKLEAAQDASMSDAFAALRLAVASQATNVVPIDARAEAARAIKSLDAAGKVAKKLKLRRASAKLLIAGLEETYAKGRQTLARALKASTDEPFHDLRKCAQYHCRQLQLVSAVWPELIAVHIETARKLAQLLGDDHDLSVLIGFIHSQPPEKLTIEHQSLLAACARDRQKVLRALAEPCAACVFAMAPKDFSAFLQTLWAAAVKLQPARTLTVIPNTASGTTRGDIPAEIAAVKAK